MAAERALRRDPAARGRRIRIALACSVCGNRNYQTTKNPNDSAVMSLKKFCNHCNQHTIHSEGK